MLTIRAVEQCGAVHYFKTESRTSAMLLIDWLKFALGTQDVAIL